MKTLHKFPREWFSVKNIKPSKGLKINAIKSLRLYKVNIITGYWWVHELTLIGYAQAWLDLLRERLVYLRARYFYYTLKRMGMLMTPEGCYPQLKDIKPTMPLKNKFRGRFY